MPLKSRLGTRTLNQWNGWTRIQTAACIGFQLPSLGRLQKIFQTNHGPLDHVASCHGKHSDRFIPPTHILHLLPCVTSSPSRPLRTTRRGPAPA